MRRFWSILSVVMAPEGDGGAGGGADPDDDKDKGGGAGGEGDDDKDKGGNSGGDKGGAGDDKGKGGNQEPVAVFQTNEQLNERLNRATDSQLKKMFGTADRSQIKKDWDEFQNLKKERDEQKRKEMSDAERYQKDLADRDQELASTREELEELTFSSHVTGVCASLGIKNVDYAKYIVAKKSEGMSDDEELDVKEWLSEQLKDASVAAALGIAVETKTKGADTSPKNQGGDGSPPKPSPSNGETDVTKMSKQEFQQHMAQKYGGAP